LKFHDPISVSETFCTVFAPVFPTSSQPDVQWPGRDSGGPAADTIHRDPPRASSPGWSDDDSEEEIMASDRIRELNDALRRTFVGGRIVTTMGVDELSDEDKAAALSKVRSFEQFDRDNDPYGEHDFGNFEHAGVRYFFKIDLYEEPDVKDTNGEAVITRVLTIMLAEEY
jgi:Protein of unknown function (DUF3768)